MKEETCKVIESILLSDKTVSKTDREIILSVCRNPVPALTTPHTIATVTTSSQPAQDYSIPETANRLDVCVSTVNRMIRDNQLPSHKVRGCRRISAHAIHSLQHPETMTAGGQIPTTELPVPHLQGIR